MTNDKRLISRRQHEYLCKGYGVAFEDLESPQKWIPYKAGDKVENGIYFVTTFLGTATLDLCDDNEFTKHVIAYAKTPTPYNEKWGLGL